MSAVHDSVRQSAKLDIRLDIPVSEDLSDKLIALATLMRKQKGQLAREILTVQSVGVLALMQAGGTPWIPEDERPTTSDPSRTRLESRVDLWISEELNDRLIALATMKRVTKAQFARESLTVQIEGMLALMEFSIAWPSANDYPRTRG